MQREDKSDPHFDRLPRRDWRRNQHLDHAEALARLGPHTEVR